MEFLPQMIVLRSKNENPIRINQTVECGIKIIPLLREVTKILDQDNILNLRNYDKN